MATKCTLRSTKDRPRAAKNHPIIAEFHFSPIEHALFMEMTEAADIERLVETLFAVDVPTPLHG